VNAAIRRARHRALGALGPAIVGRPPALDAATWRAMADLTDQHHLSPALRAALVKHPGMGVPDDVSARLDTAYRQNFGRSMRIADQLHHAIATLNSAGVNPAPLKGSLHMLEGTFGHRAERVMADLDLLVDPADLDPAIEALRRAGYRSGPSVDFKVVHDLVMVAPARQVPVEIHCDLGTPAVTEVLPAAVYLEGPVVERDGVTYRVAHPAHVVLHNVLHAQLQDRNHQVFGLPLRQLHTLVVFVDRQRDLIDWSEVRARMTSSGLAVVLDGYLDLARRFMALPPGWAPGSTPTLRARRGACLLNAYWGGRPGYLVRNLQDAFASDYLRDRYGPGGSVSRLRFHHAATLWRARGEATLSEAVVGSRWR
jgi:hypothetical protein